MDFRQGIGDTPARYRSSVPYMTTDLPSKKRSIRTRGSSVSFRVPSSNPVNSNLIPPTDIEADESLKLLETKSQLNTHCPRQRDIDHWKTSKQRITPKETKRMSNYIETYIETMKATHQHTTTDTSSEPGSASHTPPRLSRVFGRSPYYKSNSAPLINAINPKLTIMEKFREFAAEEGMKLPAFLEPPDPFSMYK